MYLFDQWKNACKKFKIAFNHQLSISEFLSPHYERTKWQEDGLKNDKISFDNATILSRCSLYPLIIDPSSSMSQYLMRSYKNDKIVKTTFQEPNFQRQLENAIRFGSPLLIEDVERVDPLLLSVLGKEIRKASGRVLISLGTKEIDFCPTFRLFLLSKNPNVYLPPEICSRLTLVNFTVTRSSLKNEILDRTLEAERPDISQKRQDLLKLQGEYQLKLRILEDQLLESLNSSSGNILNDETVITHLEKLQSESLDLSNKSREADSTLAQIEGAALHYSMLSQKCSDIYFLLERFSSLNRSYQFSVEWFLTIFSDFLKKNQINSISSASRLNFLFMEIYRTFFERIALSLLQCDRLVLLFGLFELKNDLDEILDKRWMDFLLGISISDIGEDNVELPEHVPTESLDRIKGLLALPGFGNLIDEMQNSRSWWAKMFSDSNAQIDIPEFSSTENGMIYFI